jgi:cellulose biosynthesis protein BcsQ
MTSTEQIQLHLQTYFAEQGNTASVDVRRAAGKSFTVTVVSDRFRSLTLTQREAVFRDGLHGLDQATRAAVDLYLLYDPEEYQEIQAMRGLDDTSYQHPLPFWSDVLLSSAAQATEADQAQRQRPLVVTFYSFKGGVGRSTSLAMVARDLAVSHNLTVVALDFDLEAPGLSTLFPQEPDSRQSGYGVLDYLHQRWLDPNASQPSIADCIQSIDLGSRRGRLYLIGAGQFDEDYVHRLADLDVEALYQSRGRDLLSQFQNDIIRQVNPDLILIDARTGFNRLGGVAVLDLADLVILCLSPNAQGRQGTHWVVAAIQRLQESARPALTYRFVLTPFPATNAEGQRTLRAEMEEWFEQHRPIGGEDLLVEELYTRIDYDARVPLLTDFRNGLPDDVVARYQGLTNFIDGALAEPVLKPQPPEIDPALDRKRVLNEMRFAAPIASSISNENLEFIFQRTGDFDRFIDDRTALIRGAKGTGKTMLFRLFVEFPKKATDLAHRSNTWFIGVHGRKDRS